MDFREASNDLFSTVQQAELAQLLGVSLSAIRQARVSVGSKAYRKPPKGWEDAIIRLCERRVGHYRQLIECIRLGQAEK